MPDLTSHLLPRLQNHTLPGINLGHEFIYPNYDGLSISNIPDTICGIFGVPEIGDGPLIPKIGSPLRGGIRKVILILMDALALHRFQTWMDSIPIWKTLLETGVLAPLTSVTPSTTSSALTTFWTGRSPASHGIIGYEMWTKEFGMISNMILHGPMTFPGDVGSLEKAGFKPESFLIRPTLGSHLWNYGVKTYAFQHTSIAKSGLSEMFMRDAEIIPFQTPAAKWVSIRQLLEGKPDEKMYIWTYWGAVDGLSHYEGPEDDRVYAEFSSYSAAFEKFFFEKLSPAACKDTLVILTADHGQTHTPLKSDYLLKNHPELTQHFIMNPTCENRLAFLYVRSGREDAVRTYFDKVWRDQFIVIEAETVLQAGLFGPGPYHPSLRDRIGDLIVIARDDAYLWWSGKKDFLLGRHGGMNPHDMLVPFLASRL